MIHISIPLPPVTKKNSQQIMRTSTGKPFVMPSKQYREYEEKAVWYVKGKSVTGAVNVQTLFYMPTKRRVDLVNLQEAVLDILVKYGALPDDNCKVVRSMDGSRVLYDKDNPRTEIYITKAPRNMLFCFWQKIRKGIKGNDNQD